MVIAMALLLAQAEPSPEVVVPEPEVDAISGSAEVVGPDRESNTEDRGPKTEDRGPKTDDREPTTENREPRTEGLVRADVRGSLIASDPNFDESAEPSFFDSLVPRLSFDDVEELDLAYRRSVVGRLLATWRGPGRFSVSGGLLLELDRRGVLEDRGSFFRAEHDLGPARLAFVGFPLTSQRTRLGYSHLVSASASELMGAEAPRAAQVEVVADEGYVFVAGSAATGGAGATEHALWLTMAGFGASLFEGVGFELQGAYGRTFTEIDPGFEIPLELTDLQNGGGVSARLSFVDGLEIDRPVDYSPLDRDLFVTDTLRRSAPCDALCFGVEGELLWLWMPRAVVGPLGIELDPLWSGAFAVSVRLATPTLEVRLTGAMRELPRLVDLVIADLGEAAVDEQSELRVVAVVGRPIPEQGFAWRVSLGVLDPARLERDASGERIVYLEGEPLVLDADEGGLVLDAKVSLLGAVADHAVFAIEPFVRRDPNSHASEIDLGLAAPPEWRFGANVVARAFF